MLKIFLLLALAFVTVPASAIAKPRPFWLIAHRANSLAEIPFVLERGFNGMEIDLRLCSGELAVDHDLCAVGFYTSWEEWLKTLESQPPERLRRLALLVLDIKEYSEEVVVRLRDDLRNSNVMRKIPRVFSVDRLASAQKAFTPTFLKSLNPQYEAVDISENESPEDIGRWYDSMKVKRRSRWYADGACAACLGQDRVDRNLQEALGVRGRGKLNRVYSWTYQSDETVREKLASGIDGLIVNTGTVVIGQEGHYYYAGAEDYERLLDEQKKSLRLARVSDF